jgi:hypothetical protein
VVVVGIVLAFVMPESRPASRPHGVREVEAESSLLLRTMWTGFTRQLRDARIGIGVIGTIRTALYAGAVALLPDIGLLGAATARMRPHTTPALTEQP